MRISLLVGLLTMPTLAAAQTVQPGAWTVTSIVVELSIPGTPRFVQALARGKARKESKRLSVGQGVEALLAPDPKARCRIDSQSLSHGRYIQALTCPQKRGEPVHISRAGTYDESGFTGSATVTGATPKGALRIALEQHAARVGS